MKLSSLLLFFGLFCGAAQAILINGAGATFPYPIYSKWFSEYHKLHPEVEINYSSIGSGGGIRQFTEKTIDFGATDAPMADNQLAKSPNPILHIPTVMGAIVVTYNLPGIENGLRLTPELLSDIFLGEIKSWSDPRILQHNQGKKLSGDIVVVYRADGSGTTNIFTDYLSKVSPKWKQKVGTGTAVSWPTGLGGKGNEGVAGTVKQTPGSVGYVELVYAQNNKMTYAALQNKAGVFTEPIASRGKKSRPNLDPVSAAATGVTIPNDFRVSLTNPEGKSAYPICGFTYLLIYQNLPDPVKGPKILEFIKWAMKDGQKMADELYYAPLPAAVVARVEEKLKTVRTEGAKTN